MMYHRRITPMMKEDGSSTESDNANIKGVSYFYHSLKPVVVAAEFFGIMPLNSSYTSDPTNVRFVWLSFKTIYAYSVLVFLSTICFMSLKNVFGSLSSTASAKDITAIMSGFIFHFSAVFSIGFFFNLARRFPELMQTWDDISSRMIKYVDFENNFAVTGGGVIAIGEVERHNLKRLYVPQSTMVLVASGVMISAFLDRILHDFRFTLSDLCSRSNATSYTECYLEHNAGFLAQQVGYQDWAAAAILIVNTFTTFTWNFLDLFIVLLSLGLYRNFLHLNRYLDMTRKCRRRAEDWKIIREDHLALANLVGIVDNAISVGILYCYAANLVSICTQMFLGLRPRNSAALETSYTTVSFIHLVFRTGLVTWTASRVNDAFQVPLKYIHSCETSSYSLETQRLRAHILETPAALSGCRFFYITRSFFLGIVSVVITYEVIFLELK